MKILEKIKSLKKQLEDLNNQIIDFDLPKNYNQMSDEENDMEIERAIDEIIDIDPFGIYTKVYA